MHHARHWVAAILAVVGAATVACSTDEPEPVLPSTSKSSSPLSGSSSGSPETTEPSPEPRKPWQRRSYDGAEAFATHWFDVFSAAMPTGDTTEMRAISDPECVNCNATFETLEGFYEDGGYYKSPGWRVAQATALKSAPINTPTVGLEVRQGRARVKDSAAGKERIEQAWRQAYVAELRWTSDGWLMVRFEPVG